jgi:thiamine pyrophosphate-dependent acetolactate synthase large subunit-like protein
VPTEAQLATDTGGATPATPSVIVEHPASDFMVDVIKALGIEYVAANPGSSFDSIQESIINYGGNSKPEFLTCCHEESSVAMAHGYAKIDGKPMLAMLHGTVGIQHAAMAIYNAYGDRAPVYMIAGNGKNAVLAHAAQDMAAMVRDCLKWDDEPSSPSEFASSAMRAYRIAMTPPMAPVLLVVDNEMQLSALNQPPRLPRFTMPAPPGADIDSVRDIAKQLVAAENPRIAAGRAARTPNGIKLLVQLAELLQAPVGVGGERVNFPSRHPLAGNGTGQADLILALEGGGGGAGGRARTISISTADLLATRNFEEANPAVGDLAVTADPEASLPSLIDEVRRLITPERKRAFEERGAKHAEAHRQARLQTMDAARYGWDASPISLARLAAELWPLIKNEDWSLVSPQGFIGNWPGRLWNFDKHYQYIGSQGAGGMGYGAPAAVGAALANRKYGRLSINIQTDGDLNYAPGILWTAVHHKIPLLTIMHNNRAYHQEFMFMQRMATWHNRGADRAHIGTTLTEPDIDYAQMAKAYGMYGEGPISDPKDLVPAFKRGIERVKRGEPALIDVITQPR